jgi:hypothetical protein
MNKDMETVRSAELVKEAPTKLQLLAGSVWPSIRRAFRSIFSILGFPLFLLAAVSVIKYLNLADLIELKGLALRIVETQEDALDQLGDVLLRYGVSFPLWLADAFALYLSIGNTWSRAEKDDLVAVENGNSDRWKLFWEWISRGRVDSLLLSLPRITREGFVRLFWPLMALYRLKTPFVVDGPGPEGDSISSSVPRRELTDFARMVTEAHGTWEGQTVYDFRQIFLWHLTLVAGAAVILGQTLSLIG